MNHFPDQFLLVLYRVMHPNSGVEYQRIINCEVDEILKGKDIVKLTKAKQENIRRRSSTGSQVE